MTLMEAYQQFIQTNPSMRVGKSKFCSLRSKWIKTTTPHDVCYPIIVRLHCAESFLSF